ncbi:triphosphoribosyl-dephospho-CoA synthase MdcB [uncultured Cohaesibacter sp.]|uniref:triphosphoribosyl-dephospho-CoA synthase MdcB n=1 Tax=uncultured Cohaesibacter sp. TaxID=1002546 RepID=UPI0029C8CB6A|nr:triphosphoribosyl-dephospho-CoA synthase MdcB [uncultured Cohaesibacter sp.]
MIWTIGSAVLSGLLLEVTSYPKPGLVAPHSMGSHKDMDLQSFMLSSAAIAPCLYACARVGLMHDGAAFTILPIIRDLGREFDRRLLRSTHGVNTQRGALFCAGVISAAAGRSHKTGGGMTAKDVLKQSAKIVEGICERELINANPIEAKTAGEILYRDHGTTGIRGEVEAGFPTVLNFGLPALIEALDAGCDLNHALVYSLIELIAKADDTTVLWRGGKKAQDFIRNEAARICASGNVLTSEGLRQIAALNDACIARNISPGGAADLLSVTAAVYLLEHQVFPQESMIQNHQGSAHSRS